MVNSRKIYWSITALHRLLTVLDLIRSFISNGLSIWMSNSSGSSLSIFTNFDLAKELKILRNVANF